MMNHDDYLDQIPDYVLGVLPTHEIAGIEEHLTTCKTCRQAVTDERRIGRLIHVTLESAARPDASRLRLLMPVVPQKRSRRPPLPGWRRQLQPALILILLVLAGFMVNGLFAGGDMPALVATAHAATATTTTTPTATEVHVEQGMRQSEDVHADAQGIGLVTLPAVPSPEASRPRETPGPPTLVVPIWQAAQ
jgi:anti-sigma factor RsiW